MPTTTEILLKHLSELLNAYSSSSNKDAAYEKLKAAIPEMAIISKSSFKSSFWATAPVIVETANGRILPLGGAPVRFNENTKLRLLVDYDD